MYYRPVVYYEEAVDRVGHATEHGLVTLIPFIEKQPLTKTERKQLAAADCFLESLPYPCNFDGDDVYVKYRKQQPKAWFTEAGEKKFGAAMRVVENLAKKYLPEFGYSAPKTVRIRKLNVADRKKHSIVYEDEYQVIECFVADKAPSVLPNAMSSTTYKSIEHRLTC